MKRLIERFSDRTRDARCSRLTLPNFPTGRHYCLIIVFSCPVKRFDSAHPEFNTVHLYVNLPLEAQVLPIETDISCGNGFKCSVCAEACSNESSGGWTFMSVAQSRECLRSRTLRCKRNSATTACGSVISRTRMSKVQKLRIKLPRCLCNVSRYSGANPAISNRPDC